jgi:hypothetical protein
MKFIILVSNLKDITSRFLPKKPPIYKRIYRNVEGILQLELWFLIATGTIVVMNVQGPLNHQKTLPTMVHD